MPTSAIGLAASFAWAMLISAGVSHATVVEFNDDGSPIVTNLVKPVGDAENTSPLSPLTNLTPRKLSKLGLEQLVFRKIASDTALRYAGSDGVKAAGLGALAFVDVFTALIHRESNYDPQTVSSKGAQGLGQLIPETAKDLGVVNVFDARENLDGSARYLSQMLKRFGSLELALAAYNAGPANVTKHKGVPPFKETRQYVVDIFNAAGIETDLSRPVDTTVKIPVTKPQIPNPKIKVDEGVQSVWEY